MSYQPPWIFHGKVKATKWLLRREAASLQFFNSQKLSTAAATVVSS
jgi:hypothetical protein